MVAARLRQTGAISQPTYDRLSAEYRQHWFDRQALGAGRGGRRTGYYQLRSHRLGNAAGSRGAHGTRSPPASRRASCWESISSRCNLLDLRTFGGNGRAA
jgi:hypothetical protein